MYYGRTVTSGNKDEWNIITNNLRKLHIPFDIKTLSSNGEYVTMAWRIHEQFLEYLPHYNDIEDGKSVKVYYLPFDDESGYSVYPMLEDPLDFLKNENNVLSNWRKF